MIGLDEEDSSKIIWELDFLYFSQLSKNICRFAQMASALKLNHDIPYLKINYILKLFFDKTQKPVLTQKNIRSVWVLKNLFYLFLVRGRIQDFSKRTPDLPNIWL